MIEKTVSRSVIYIALECILLTEGITAGSVAMSLCLFVCLALSAIIPQKNRIETVLSLLPFSACFLATALFTHTSERAMLIPVALLSGVILWVTGRLNRLRAALHSMQDADRELEMMLREQNSRLLKSQEYEIRLATMSERNRIAREIHDNVGHMLSRALIMLGAIRTVNRDDYLSPHLDLLDRTLNTAMQEMRDSVHDLHDDSIDFRKAIDDMAEELKASRRCRVMVDVDIETELERYLKITLIAIAREAVSNYLKHSNGDKVEITVHEHPGFCTLSVGDNGTLTPETIQKVHSQTGTDRGNGLNNIRERVKALGGTAYFYTDHGFRVFVNLPKGAKASENFGQKLS